MSSITAAEARIGRLYNRMHFGTDNRPHGYVLASPEEIRGDAERFNQRTKGDTGGDLANAQCPSGVRGGDRQEGDRDATATANESGGAR